MEMMSSIERNEIIRVKLRDGSGDSRLPVRLVSEPGLMAEFGLRLFKKNGIATVPRDTESIDFAEPDPPFHRDRNGGGRSGDRIKIRNLSAHRSGRPSY